jgi:hypothetical protein
MDYSLMLNIANNDEVRAWLRSCALDALNEIAEGFAPSRLRRVRGGFAWSEAIEGEEVQFECIVYECNESSMHFGVSAALSTRRERCLGISGPCVTVDKIMMYQ